MAYQEEYRQYAYWLCNLPGIGNRAIANLLQACGGTPREVYCASEKVWETVLTARQLEQMKQVTSTWDLEKEYCKMEDLGIHFLLQENEEYPEKLRNIPDAPYGLFYKGKLPKEQQISVAIIGARDCSPYGSYVATELGKYLGEKGVQIISGMARGIDGISQESALTAGGVSFGVLGCGVDICYPAQNRKLYERLLIEGGVLSTHPPGTEARPQHFPPRNRIVSGLADAVVVIEARNKSGTLITVDMALEQGKDVYVVPGRITDRLSDGCNNLLRQGAGVVISPQDFYSEIVAAWEERRRIWKEENKEGIRNRTGRGNANEKKAEKQRNRQKGNTTVCEMGKRKVLPELQEVYNALDFYPQSIDRIMEKLSESYHLIQVNTSLMRLCMDGLAEQLSPGYFCRK